MMISSQASRPGAGSGRYSNNAITFDFDRNKIVIGKNFQEKYTFGTEAGFDIKEVGEEVKFVVTSVTPQHQPAIFKKYKSSDTNGGEVHLGKCTIKTNRAQNILSYLKPYSDKMGHGTSRLEIYPSMIEEQGEPVKMKVKYFPTRLGHPTKNKWVNCADLDLETNLETND